MSQKRSISKLPVSPAFVEGHQSPYLTPHEMDVPKHDQHHRKTAGKKRYEQNLKRHIREHLGVHVKN